MSRARLTRLHLIGHAALQAVRCESEGDREGALRLIAALGDLSPDERAALRVDLRGHRNMLGVRRSQHVVR